MMEIKLTTLQAYKAMIAFIEAYYSRGGKPDELGNLLGFMELLDEGITSDPAMWDDWVEAVKRVLETESNDSPRK